MASLIVNGSQRRRSPVRNQPLKSAHQTALGASTARKGEAQGGHRRRSRRACVIPSLRSQSPIVLLARGSTPGRRSASFRRSFLGPQVGHRSRNAKAALTTASARERPSDSGARLRSFNPTAASNRYSDSHLYPLFRLIPEPAHV